ncbi:Hypothetical predicted protein, partial [Cloeon dipterum]
EKNNRHQYSHITCQGKKLCVKLSQPECKPNILFF